MKIMCSDKTRVTVTMSFEVICEVDSAALAEMTGNAEPTKDDLDRVFALGGNGCGLDVWGRLERVRRDEPEVFHGAAEGWGFDVDLGGSGEHPIELEL